jgi:soluble lytic murein transglycosylase-like protein
MNLKEIISFFEKKYDIPPNLLTAIAKVESANSPWAIYALGRSRIFSNKNAAIKHIKSLIQQGVTNINVGYMQINLASHRRKFKTLEDSITPYHNIAYAAHLIKRLYLRYGSWESAVRFYHSQSPVYNLPYQQKVFKAWNKVSAQPISNKPPKKAKASLKMVLSPSAGISNSTIR